MDGAERLRAHRDEILRIAAKYGAHNVRVFGSIARSEADAESDIDLLVDLEPGRSLFDLGGLWADLNALLGMRDRIRDRVLREAVPL